MVHGHSAHHVKGIEVYRERLILYGCGDFFNDYEGIGGYEAFRGDLSLMYFPTLEPASGRLKALRMTPTQVRRFRLQRPQSGEIVPTSGHDLAAIRGREGSRGHPRCLVEAMDEATIAGSP